MLSASAWGSVRRLLACAALILLAVPGAAQGFNKAIWGDVYRNGVNQFPLYRQLGVSVYEVGLYWEYTAPTRPRHPSNPNDPAYVWPAEIQQAINQAKHFHMRVLIQLITSPAWANSEHASGDLAPRNPADFVAFAQAVAKRYPSVHLWMVWGEPSRQFLPAPQAAPNANLNRAQLADVHLYARMLDATYGALKAISKQNLIIGGCTYTTGTIDSFQWISNLRLPNGHPPRMDIYAHNPFSWTEPNFSAPPSPDGVVQFSDLPRLAKWIDRYLRPGLPIFASEWTIPTHPDEEFNFYVDPQLARRWVADALRLSRHWKRMWGLGWIHVYDNPPVSYGGLLTSSGQPKPVFYAFEHG